MTEASLFWDVFKTRNLAVSEYSPAKQYRLYYREKKADEAWECWNDSTGDFSYVYATYQGLVGESDRNDAEVEFNTLFYECVNGIEQKLIGSVHIDSDHTWRFDMVGDVPRSCTVRDLLAVDEESRDCPELRALESVSKK
jgi:hypothetical protein